MILGVDPGTAKAGYAVLDEDGTVVERGIADVGACAQRFRDLCAAHRLEGAAVGTGTNASVFLALLRDLAVPVHLVNEHETTLRARALYFADHPPRGWRRLVPIGLQLPPRPIDDYAAILIGRRYLAGRSSARRGEGDA